MTGSSSIPLDLPKTFSYAQARAAGLGKRQLYRLRDAGEIIPISHGIYRRAGAEVADLDLLEIASRHGLSTLCLTSALSHHGLTDAIPHRIDIALPRGTRPPTCKAPVAWHFFHRDRFELGRGTLSLDDDLEIGLYSAQRCIIDAFRTRGTGGHELAYESLKSWLAQRGTQPSTLLDLASEFPRTIKVIRQALEILL